MAKKKNKYDTAHLKNLSSYERQIAEIYKEAVREAALLGTSVPNVDADKVFSFADYPITTRRINTLLDTLQRNVSSVIINGINAEWALSNEKNDELVNSALGQAVRGLTAEQRRQYFSNNDGALQAFSERKVNGMNLSDRVWKYTDQFKSEIELGIDIGLREGRSAQQLSQDLRSYLQHPDKLFRRVRDEHGNLVLSKSAAAYHPGQGVYRSSYKNAIRMTGTETNMAYRTADHNRWQQLDFVVGQEIHTSNNHTLNGKPLEDMCDELAGKYPKDFEFTGWHPNCRCYATSILKSREEMREDSRRIMNGEEPLPAQDSVNYVPSVPQKFEDWVIANEERIARAKSMPYFIKDNQKVVDGILSKTAAQTQTQQTATTATQTQQVQQPKATTRQEQDARGLVPEELRIGGSYLRGEDYAFDEDFFALFENSKFPSLRISKLEKTSYARWNGDVVVLADNPSLTNSSWQRKSVVYHEYGHCLDAHRGLWQDADLKDMRQKQIDWLKGKTDKTLTVRSYDYKRGYFYTKRTYKSRVAYIDARLQELDGKIVKMKASTFDKYNITKEDVREQILAVRDTIKSLDVRYGCGHTTSYFSKMRTKETEYLAHAFENTFIGNRVFQKMMPDIYDEMIQYIKALKKP